MKFTEIDGIIINKNKILSSESGNVLHALKKTDLGYASFGEAYFSEIKVGKIKGWKRHKKMIMNIIVPNGEIKFLFFDDREGSSTFGFYQEIILSRNNYCRVTIPEMIWVLFKNVGNDDAILLNIANITHNPNEVDTKELNEISHS